MWIRISATAAAARSVEADFDFVDKSAAAAKQCRPEVLAGRRRRRPFEQLRLRETGRDRDVLLAFLAAIE